MHQQVDGFHFVQRIFDTALQLVYQFQFAVPGDAVDLRHMRAGNIRDGRNNAAFPVVTGHLIIRRHIAAGGHIIGIIIADLIAVIVIDHPALAAADNDHTVGHRLHIRIG